MNVVQKLRQTVGELRAPKGPSQAKEGWELAGRLLGRVSNDLAEIDRVCTARDIDGLDALVSRIEAKAKAPAAPAAAKVEMTPELESAMNAFRKRLKLARLADESKLAGRRLTAGRSSEIDAIIPPTEFPPEVWATLARAGKLKDTGQGFYALV